MAKLDDIDAEAQRQRNELIVELAAARVQIEDLREENALLRRRGLRVVNPREAA